MNFLNLALPIKNSPALDAGFVPLSLFFREHQKKAEKPFAVSVRADSYTTVYETKIIGTPEYEQADRYYLDRLVKFLLWGRGGYELGLWGDEALGKTVQEAYSPGGARAFDDGFMQRVYKKPFTVVLGAYENKPQPKSGAASVGRHMAGCRIGFDAGGSDRKVSAVIDGEAIYSEEVVWFPKEQANPDYHYEGIVTALKTAAEKLPRVDGIGISSAGVYIDNHCRVASLFIKVSDQDFKEKVEDIYLRAAKEIGGDIPVAVANDGDVTALAGAMSLNATGVLGIAMGTSEAVGYVDTNGNITGWLNELAFAPVDGNPEAMRDEWSGDIGCGVKYFSQDGIIKLAGFAGIELMGQSPAEKLREVQALMAAGDKRAAAIYQSIGVYLGHALALYAEFYEIEHVLMLGRVMSGAGGDIILAEAARVLAEEYPDCKFAPKAPDEQARRVGQSVAAASLPE